jgi:Cu2+-exporting ATPase
LAALILGPLTFVVWYVVAGPPLVFAFTLAITVVVITCPHALGLATPMAIRIATSMGARRGTLFKNAVALEDSSRLQAVIMDKTGTLTKGEPEVVDVVPSRGLDAEPLVAMAAAIERGSEHSPAKAILKRAEGMPLLTVAGFEASPGHGARAEGDGHNVFVGNLRLMESRQVAMNGMRGQAEELARTGRTVIYVARDGRVAGLIAVADAPRVTARETVQRLKERGLEVFMLTGDHRATARRSAADVSIEQVFAEVLPAEKVDKVREVQQ